MDLTDILLSCILAVLVRREVITSDWLASTRRNIRRRGLKSWAKGARRRLKEIERQDYV